MDLKRFLDSARTSALLAIVCFLAGHGSAAMALTVDLSVTPPDLTASVDPNLAVTFDDSGSMVWTAMGDYAPYKNGDKNSWKGPWRCAGVIDPTIEVSSASTPEQKAKARAMNGVYYNPRVKYEPPLFKDGTTFPSADATLRKVWLDGIAVNRPLNKITAATNATYANNPDSNGSASDAGVADLMGKYSSVTNTNVEQKSTSCANNPVCPAEADSGSCSTTTTGCTGGKKKINYTVTKTTTTVTDNRWQCGTGSPSGVYGGAFTDKNPFDGSNGSPNGGPYYYRFTGTLSVGANGKPDAAGIAALYTASNWTPVAVPEDQYQNFANWYAYYRNRNLMARTALSRVFGSLGDNVRVAYQNLGNNDAKDWGRKLANGSSIISNLTDVNTTGNSAADNYRTKFFNWVFSVGGNSGTPARAATQRASAFFQQGEGVKSLTNPYYQPGIGETVNGVQGMELSCRQNFHMLLTDGFWNEGDSDVTTPGKLATASTPFPDDGSTTPATAAPFSYDPSAAETYIYSNNSQNKKDKSLANIAFHYWATDLRTDAAMPNRVARYVPDKSTNLDGTGALASGADPMSNKVIYFNPANDVATWQHVVQFMIALGIDGELRYPEDYVGLRTKTMAWPTPAADAPAAIDDMWHAAVNSRGSYFSASDPGALVQYLGEVIANILVRRGSSTSLSATMSILTQGTQGYVAGYDSSDWSGFLNKRTLDPDTGVPGDTLWDAGCKLTGNGCRSGNVTVTNGRDPSTRKIYTYGASNSRFEWDSLTTAQQLALRATGETIDTNARLRLAWLRGDRTQESTTPQLRRRSSVLGAIINSQPVYISGATGGFPDNFPAGSPEAQAKAANKGYSKFVYDNRDRAPTVYVGSNDGMLHAFNAVDGTERWAYVPNMLFTNGKLLKLTDPTSTQLVSGVDDMPVIQDVFFGGKWRTVLVNSMRMGGRGVFALDITNPAAPEVLWEFTNTSSGGAPLGYTYSSANIARLNSGKWVALVSSGYFSKDPLDPTSSDANKDSTSLLVLDLETGSLIKAIKTPTISGVASFGLSAPALYDSNGDWVDDYSVAGDLAGNLWRFDLSSSSSADWKAELMFKTYTTAPTQASPSAQPISVMPVAMRDQAAGTPIWVFGTGKYIGAEDRTASGSPSNVGPQAFYGIRDYGKGSAAIAVGDLTAQTLTQDNSGVRSLSKNTIPLASKGWKFSLSPSNKEKGERAVVTAVPFYATNRVMLTTLIPNNNDPCSPGRRGAIMIVDAGMGGAAGGGAPVAGTPPTGSDVVGKAIDSDGISPVTPPTVIGQQGGGSLLLPGIPEFKIPDPPYHRGAWRELREQ